jgi:hypothetical protein
LYQTIRSSLSSISVQGVSFPAAMSTLHFGLVCGAAMALEPAGFMNVGQNKSNNPKNMIDIKAP